MTVSRRDRILVGSGVIAISIGVFLPWLKINPNLPPDAKVLSVQNYMNAGFSTFDCALLGLVGLVLGFRVVSSHERLETALTLLTGIGTVVFCAHYLSGSSLTGFTTMFVPALGWYLTILGGALLTAAGGLRLPSIIRATETTTLMD